MIKEWLKQKFQCNRDNKVQSEKNNKQSDGEKKMDDLIDEEYQRELIRLDQLKFETPSYFIFKYDGMFR